MTERPEVFLPRKFVYSCYCIYDIRFFDYKFFHDFKMCLTCKDKEITKTCGSFMIVTMTGQHTICVHNEISYYKISFTFTIYNIIKRYKTCEDMENYDFKTYVFCSP